MLSSKAADSREFIVDLLFGIAGALKWEVGGYMGLLPSADIGITEEDGVPDLPEAPGEAGEGEGEACPLRLTLLSMKDCMTDASAEARDRW